MVETYRHLDVEQIGDVFCLGLRQPRLDAPELEELLADIDRCVLSTGCRKVVFLMGPEEPQCMYSVFLAKLVALQKRLQQAGGALKIAEASQTVQNIFEACRLRHFFNFAADRNEAIAALNQ
jgi:anti-anti-sigma factor